MNISRMPRTLACLVLLLSMLVGLAPVRAEIYRWTDENGKVHFTDHKPSGDTGQAEPFQGSARTSFLGGGTGTRTAATKIRMFTTQWCPVCKKAKAYLKKRGTPFEELDVETSQSAKREFDRLGGKGVPVILVGQQRMNGFDAEEMESMLANAGL